MKHLKWELNQQILFLNILKLLDCQSVDCTKVYVFASHWRKNKNKKHKKLHNLFLMKKVSNEIVET